MTAIHKTEVGTSEERAKAMQTALGFLRERARTEHEIREKLTKKEFDEDIISYVVGRLRALGVLDDTRFAKEWVQARVKKALGARRIRQELRRKGLSDADIAEALALITEDEDSDDSDSISNISRNSAAVFARRAVRRLDGQPDAVVMRKITQALVRRGYSWQDARGAALSAMEAEGASGDGMDGNYIVESGDDFDDE